MQKDSEENDHVIIVDIDGTLCDIKARGQDYRDLVPRHAVVEKLREYQSKGYRVVLFTSRNMKTYKGNLGLINKYTAPVILE